MHLSCLCNYISKRDGGRGLSLQNSAKSRAKRPDPVIDCESSLKCDAMVFRWAQRPCASSALPSSVLRMSGSARLKHVVSALSLSDLHLNAAARVYLLWGEPVPHDWFWLIPSDFHVDLHHFTLTLLPHDLVSGLKETAEEATFVKSTLYHASPARQHIYKRSKKLFTRSCVWRSIVDIDVIFSKMKVCFNNTIIPTFYQVPMQTHCFNWKHNSKYSLKINKTAHLEYFLKTLYSMKILLTKAKKSFSNTKDTNWSLGLHSS